MKQLGLATCAFVLAVAGPNAQQVTGTVESHVAASRAAAKARAVG